MPEPPSGEITVEEARSRMLAATAPLGVEEVALPVARGRVLAEPVLALRDQPPFDAAAMDGYAVRVGEAGPSFRVVGESAAGHAFPGAPGPGEAIRIFTGAETPEGCRVLVQERARRSGEAVSFDSYAGGDNVRRRGGDFGKDEVLLQAGLRLDPWRLALAASGGAGRLRVTARPRVAILATGEEIVPAGSAIGPAQIYDSGTPSLGALIEETGGVAIAAGPVGDDPERIASAVADLQADLLVTVGGASVGDHDLVKPALATLGLRLEVETVRLRPGKPTWFGRLRSGLPVLGLPGNPASALVCAELFLRPLIRALLGAPPGPALETAELAAPLPAGGIREHWMRGRFEPGEAPLAPARVRAFAEQDSSLVRVFADAGVLIRRPAHAPAAEAGARVEVLRLGRL